MAKDDWTEPGVYEVVPGVHRIPLPLPNDGLRAVNVYAITGPDGPVLVDSGWAIPIGLELLEKGLAELGAEFADIARFLITHMHRDHYSQAIEVKAKFGTRVTLGAEERWSLEIAMRPGRVGAQEQGEFLRELGAPDIADALAANRPKHRMEEWDLPTDWFTPNEVIEANGRSLEAVETPGHTRGHVVFFDTPNALLFSGDHVLPTITPSIGFEPALAANPLGAFLESLAIVRSRPDTMLLPAHGPVAPSSHDRVDELVEHHRLRLDAMAAVVGWGAQTAAEVAAKTTWTKRERTLDELDLFNKFLAVCETGAHLTLLVAQGRATMTLRDGVRCYSLTGD
ncbi:MAG: MBL fold metallo-hydrolase [Frankiaceae bacterium]|nr:MBL fold metallo-hydrolase [Frankiaceae bacterium]MBV9872455.1 MBL fold metallo-hydrolase [Frankiaceae bacterium]